MGRFSSRPLVSSYFAKRWCVLSGQWHSFEACTTAATAVTIHPSGTYSTTTGTRAMTIVTPATMDHATMTIATIAIHHATTKATKIIEVDHPIEERHLATCETTTTSADARAHDHDHDHDHHQSSLLIDAPNQLCLLPLPLPLPLLRHPVVLLTALSEK